MTFLVDHDYQTQDLNQLKSKEDAADVLASHCSNLRISSAEAKELALLLAKFVGLH